MTDVQLDVFAFDSKSNDSEQKLTRIFYGLLHWYIIIFIIYANLGYLDIHAIKNQSLTNQPSTTINGEDMFNSTAFNRKLDSVFNGR